MVLAGLLLGLFIPQDSFGNKRFSKERFLGTDDIPWQITAKRLFYKEKEGLYIAEGDVVISKEDQYLYAQKVTYNIKSGMASVSEDVRFESGKDILTGTRGESPVDPAKLEDLLIRLSHMLMDLPSIEEIDINPVMITRDGREIQALDARVILKGSSPD